MFLGSVQAGSGSLVFNFVYVSDVLKPLIVHFVYIMECVALENLDHDHK